MTNIEYYAQKHREHKLRVLLDTLMPPVPLFLTPKRHLRSTSAIIAVFRHFAEMGVPGYDGKTSDV